MIIVISFFLEQAETFLVTMEDRNIPGSKNVKCSATCYNILGGEFYSLQKKFSFSIQGHTRSQISALGCGVHL